MSAATEGFSAMISAFDIESVQKKKPPDHGGFSLVFFQNTASFACGTPGGFGARARDRRSRSRTPGTSMHQVFPPVVEEFLEKEGVDVGLLAPEHHQHDHLEHFEVDGRFI